MNPQPRNAEEWFRSMDRRMKAVERRGALPPAVADLPTSRLVPVPTAATNQGTPGDWAVEPGFVYFCVAADTWQRVALSTW